MANTQRDPKLEARWRETLLLQQSSGLTVLAFCKREGLSESSFYAWRRTIAARDAATCSSGAPLFLPITLKTTPKPSARVLAQTFDAPHAIVIELRGGRALRLPDSIPTNRLVELVHALEAETQS